MELTGEELPEKLAAELPELPLSVGMRVVLKCELHGYQRAGIFII